MSPSYISIVIYWCLRFTHSHSSIHLVQNHSVAAAAAAHEKQLKIEHFQIDLCTFIIGIGYLVISLRFFAILITVFGIWLTYFAMPKKIGWFANNYKFEKNVSKLFRAKIHWYIFNVVNMISCYENRFMQFNIEFKFFQIFVLRR